MRVPIGILFLCILSVGTADATRATVADAACIARGDVRATHVRSDRRIDFDTRDGGRLRNDLPQRCRDLYYFAQIALTRARGDICPGDTFTVTNRNADPGEYAGELCALGPFSAL